MAGHPVDGLTPPQEQALAALLKEPTITLAAKASGISESNIYRWLKEPAFKAAYREARREAFAHCCSACSARCWWCGRRCLSRTSSAC